jgi:retron-type reverse transcriptase
VFHMPGEGTWLLNVIWTTPLPNTSETDFETTFSSLSFGFPPRRPQARD